MGSPLDKPARDIRLGPLLIHWSPGYWWFRLFGVGLHGKDTRLHPPLFSERYGYVWRVSVGAWSIGVLTRGGF